MIENPLAVVVAICFVTTVFAATVLNFFTSISIEKKLDQLLRKEGKLSNEENALLAAVADLETEDAAIGTAVTEAVAELKSLEAQVADLQGRQQGDPAKLQAAAASVTAIKGHLATLITGLSAAAPPPATTTTPV